MLPYALFFGSAADALRKLLRCRPPHWGVRRRARTMLPIGWTAWRCKVRGRMWYWHERSGHCTWQPPTDDTIIPEVQLSPADQVHVNGRRSLVVDINNVGHRYGARFLAARKVLSSRQGLFD